MASVEREPKRSWASIFLPWAITAALSIALVAIGISGQASDRRHGETAAGALDPERPGGEGRDFRRNGEAVEGRVFVSPGKGVVFIGASLPRIDSGKTFELWVIPAKGNPVPAGLFRSQPDATAVFVRPGPVENAAAIAVTVEPEGGSPQPTTTPFIVTKL